MPSNSPLTSSVGMGLPSGTSWITPNGPVPWSASRNAGHLIRYASATAASFHPPFLAASGHPPDKNLQRRNRCGRAWSAARRSFRRYAGGIHARAFLRRRSRMSAMAQSRRRAAVTSATGVRREPAWTSAVGRGSANVKAADGNGRLRPRTYPCVEAPRSYLQKVSSFQRHLITATIPGGMDQGGSEAGAFWDRSKLIIGALWE